MREKIPQEKLDTFFEVIGKINKIVTDKNIYDQEKIEIYKPNMMETTLEKPTNISTNGNGQTSTADWKKTLMDRNIKKAAVIGSGVMGSRIACHFANIGVEVLLLDIVPREVNDKEKAQGLTLKDKPVRNRIVNDALQFALKNNPSPIYNKKWANRSNWKS